MADAEAIAFRALPSNQIETRYMDRTRVGKVIIEAYAKSKDAQAAFDQLETYVQLLDLPDDLNLTEETTIKAEPTTQVHFIQKTEQQEFIYAMTFNVDYKTTY